MARAVYPVKGHVYVKNGDIVIRTNQTSGQETDAEILLGTVSASGFVADSSFDGKESVMCLIEMYAAYEVDRMKEADFDNLLAEWIDTH